MFNQFFIFFTLIGIGYLSRKKNWLDEASIKGVGNLLINVAIPALLLSSIFALDITGDLLIEFASMSLLSIAFFTLYAIFAAIYVRLRNIPSERKGIVQFFMITTNNGFIGLPISAAFFGEEGLFFMIANNLIMNIILFSYGVILVRTKPTRKEEEAIHRLINFFAPLKAVVNPGVVSILVGLILNVFSLIQWIPEAVITLTESLGGLATPLSMIHIDAILHSSSPSSLFRDRLVLESGLVRCSLLPLITYFILLFTNIPSLMSKIIFLATMLPTAAIIPVIVSQYGQGEEESTKFVLFSTLLSLATMPLGVYLASISF